MSGKIRMGMIGGGIGAFIGNVHRMAAALDGKIELVCGAFSSDAEKSKLSGVELNLPANRVYANFQEMIQKELALPINERMELVSIVTPNHMHYEPAKLALESGFHVICDKPLCHTIDEAYSLREVVKHTGKIFALTHTYSGYPMVKQAREMVQNGDLGTIRRVVVEYPQGWLTNFIEAEDNKQAAWRTDPSKSGIAGAMGDIGTHAEHLAEYITNSKITQLCADISIFVKGRLLDDDGNVLIRFDNGAKGILTASQIAAGEENNLRIRVYGTLGSIDWSQMEPNTLQVRWLDKPMQILRTGGHGLYPIAEANTRVPAGHPEGYLEAFANIYKNVANSISSFKKGEVPSRFDFDFPTIDDGVRGMEFIYKVIHSGRSEQKWV